MTGTSGVEADSTTPTGSAQNGSIPAATTAFDAATNRLSGTLYGYDAKGNQTSFHGQTLSYDSENRLVSVQEPGSVGGQTESLGYNGLGQRVQKTVGGVTTLYLYDAFGQVAAEYSSAAVPTAPCTTCYLSVDHLGSTRLVTDDAATVIGRHEYQPFGEEIPTSSVGRNADWGSKENTVEPRFTGQLRDLNADGSNSTNLDYFNARYYAAPLGRFTSPDPGNAGADLLHPQSWNAYSYVWNNPLGLIDPSGTYGQNNQQPGQGVPGYPGCQAYGTEGCIQLSGEFGDPGVEGDPGGSVSPGGASGGPKNPVPTISTPGPQQLTAGTKQTFDQCMAAHANDFSIIGTANALTNAAFNRNDDYKNNLLLGALLGNTFTGLVYGTTTDAAGTSITSAPYFIQKGMGTTLSYGRRTSAIMSLNLAGTGGLPLALGAASTGAKSGINLAGDVLGLWIAAEGKLAFDATLAVGEAGFCYVQTQ